HFTIDPDQVRELGSHGRKGTHSTGARPPRGISPFVHLEFTYSLIISGQLQPLSAHGI
ncbi:MAG: hypothetical protein RJB35_231, partial [Actinomycetota bacterium]